MSLKVAGIQASRKTVSQLAAPAEAISKPEKSFKSFLTALDKNKELSLHQDLQKLQKTILDGKKLDPRELLLYQIKAGQFSLNVELISKVGESLTATVRKFEQGQ